MFNLICGKSISSWYTSYAISSSFSWSGPSLWIIPGFGELWSIIDLIILFHWSSLHYLIVFNINGIWVIPVLFLKNQYYLKRVYGNFKNKLYYLFTIDLKVDVYNDFIWFILNKCFYKFTLNIIAEGITIDRIVSYYTS